jgi:hypothetical protein
LSIARCSRQGLIEGMKETYSQCTQVFVTLDFTLYISYKTTFFNFSFIVVISKLILIIFAPEEAEIFKDYLVILA